MLKITKLCLHLVKLCREVCWLLKFFFPDTVYSAKRGIAIACRLSVCVCLSVRLYVGGSRAHRLEISETNCTDN